VTYIVLPILADAQVPLLRFIQKYTMLPIYNSFDEKQANFNLKKIDTFDEFLQIKSELSNIGTGIFRGIGQAKYKIYTSLQREIILGNATREFDLDVYVKNFRANPLIRKYFSMLNLTLSQMGVLSFLQHHKATCGFL
jgi:hypothetical protein